MAKKKNTFGKFIAFTTTAAAIGGTCYVFRDKIRQSSIYRATADKASTIFDKLCKKNSIEDEDVSFFDDDLDDDNFDEMFSGDAPKGREYTSITINAKEGTDAHAEEEGPSSTDSEEIPHPVSEPSIPTISFGNTESSKKSVEPAPDHAKSDSEADGYENENLSDVSEDPDVLEEQDKLDF